MAKQSDDTLSGLHTKFSGMDQSMPSNQFMLKRVQKEMNRRKKKTNSVVDEEFVDEAKKKPMVKISVPEKKLGYKVADIGPDGKEYNVKTYGAYKEALDPVGQEDADIGAPKCMVLHSHLIRVRPFLISSNSQAGW